MDGKFLISTFGPTVLLILPFIGYLAKLARDLAKLSTTVAYQVNRDLLSKRFEAYGALWAQMGPIAVYSEKGFVKNEAILLSENLSTWYFSQSGGLLLTKKAREFYFAFQDLLGSTIKMDMPDWNCTSRPENPKQHFSNWLEDSIGKEHMPRIDSPDSMDPKKWREVCELISQKLKDLVQTNSEQAGQTVFAAIQQVSSVLRTILTMELQSRLDIQLPK